MRLSLAAVALALAIGVAAPAAQPTRAAVTDGPKVVIIVGATHAATDRYRSFADAAYAEATRYTANVVKVYSPNATWAAVKSATVGASIVIYFGHGNGWPSPYPRDATYSTKDGFGLNATAGNGDFNNKYYGEPYVSQLDLAPNAIVMLHHLCYAAGNSEPGAAQPTLSVAQQRVDNYGAGFLRTKARVVLADGHRGPNEYLRAIFTTSQTVEQLWRSASNANGNVTSFASVRTAGATAFMDPETPTSGFYRAIVGDPNLTTNAIVGGFAVPGRAAAKPAGTPLYDAPPTEFGTAALSPTAVLPAATRLRVLETASGSGDTAVFRVQGLDDAALVGYAMARDLEPRDSMAPRVATLSGAGASSTIRTGNHTLAGSFNEESSWTATIKRGSTAYASASGYGSTFFLTWDPIRAGAGEGGYEYEITGVDGWANGPSSTTGTLIIDNTVAAAVVAPDTTYRTVKPVRLLDTRSAFPAGVAKLSSGRPMGVRIAGRGGIPADAVGVTGNLTVTGQTAAGSVTLGPVVGSTPATATITVAKGDTMANGVVVPLSQSGRLEAVYNGTAGSTAQILLDVTGYFSADSAGGGYTSTTPTRFLDTRLANGPTAGAALRSGRPKAVAVGGQTVAGVTIPADAVAVTGNLTVTGQTASGYLALTPTSQASPKTSTLNFPRGDTRANNLTVPLGAGGRIWVVYRGGGTAHAIFDITGYYQTGGTGLRWVPLATGPVLDSRTGLGRSGAFESGTPGSVTVVGAGGIPADAAALTGNLTVVGQTRRGYASLTPTPIATPSTSTINFPAGQARSNGVITSLDPATGQVSLTYKAARGATTHLLLDVTGYFH